MSTPTKSEQFFLNILANEKKQSYSNSNWQDLLALILKNGMVGIFYPQFLELKARGVPTDFLAELKNFYLVNLKRNLLLEKESLEIIRHFRKAEIALLPLKGPLVARWLYGDTSFRQAAGDLDFLIHFNDLEKAEKKLAEIGYFFSGSKKRKQFILQFRGQISFLKQAPKTLNLDLHWALENRPNDFSESLWEQIFSFRFGKEKIFLPSRENLILLSVHFALRDNTFDFVPIKYLYDLHLLAAKFQKWQGLIKTARHYHFQDALFFSLKLAKEFFKTKLPPEILAELKPSFLKRNLLAIWLNKKNVILNAEKKIDNHRWWCYFGISYLYSQNFFYFLAAVSRKIFPPLEEKNYFSYFKKRFFK